MATREAYELINSANKLSDEDMDELIVIDFLNQSIGATNQELRALLPLIDENNIDDEYRVIIEVNYVDKNNPTNDEKIRASQLDSVNNIFQSILISHVSYKIKVNDGSKYEWEQALKTYEKGIRSFNQAYRQLLKPEYKTENFVLPDGTTMPEGFGIVGFGGDSPTNNAFMNNGPGTGNNGGILVDSNNPFGKK